MMREATSTVTVTLTPPAAAVTRLAVPPSVAGTVKLPLAVPFWSVMTEPRETVLPPGRRQVRATDVFAGKCAAVTLTVCPTETRSALSSTAGGSGMLTVTAPVCAACVGLSARTLFAPTVASLGTMTDRLPAPFASVVRLPTDRQVPSTSQRTRVTSFAPKPVTETVTDWPRTTSVGVTRILGAGVAVAVGVAVTVCVGVTVAVAVAVAV